MRLVKGIIKLSFIASVNPSALAVQKPAMRCGYQAEQHAGETRWRILLARWMRTHFAANAAAVALVSCISRP